ncbi:MAG: TonB-dependent receptor [Magnetococcales bacterium]|nr:TonB-dependent receptor [Magnetococcales bacterium]
MQNRLSCFVSLSLFCSISSSYAAVEHSLEELVVTATRFPVKRSAIPAHVTIITPEEIRASSATSLPDLLRGQAGIHVMDMTGNGRGFLVDLRGFGENAGFNTLVLIDGRRLNQADQVVDWAQIPLARVERVEIVRGGSGAVLYGDNSSGGVINIITRSGNQPESAVTVQTGSHGQAKGAITLEQRQSAYQYSLNAAYRTLDGYRDNGDTQATELGGMFHVKHGPNFGLQFSAGYQNDRVGWPSALKASDLDRGLSRRMTVTPDDYSKVVDYYLHMIPEIQWSGENRLLVDLTWRDRDATSFANFTAGQFTGQSSVQVWGVAPRVLLHGDWDGVVDRLTVGGDWHVDREEIQNDSLYLGVRTIGDFLLRKHSRAGYLHNELLFPEHWVFSQGVRWDQAEFFFTPSVAERRDMDRHALSLGVRHDWEEGQSIYLQFSESFRYPLLDEQYSFFTNTVNTTLKPQQVRELQLGWNRNWTPTLSSELSGFLVTTRDELYFDIVTYNNANLDGRVQRRGVTVELEKRFDDWRLSGNATWTRAEVRSGSMADQAFPGVPTLQGSVKLGWQPWEALDWDVTGRYVGSRPFISDFANQFDKQAGYVVVDTSWRYRWPTVTGWLEVTNLLGREYAEYGVLGGFPLERAWYPSPERRFMIGATARF